MSIHMPIHVPAHMSVRTSRICLYVHVHAHACAHVYIHVCAHVNTHLQQSRQHAEVRHSRVTVQHDKRPHPANTLTAVVSCDPDAKTAFLYAEFNAL